LAARGLAGIKVPKQKKDGYLLKVKITNTGIKGEYK
jgi:hypothetical protein